jgi:hypothetical protein
MVCTHASACTRDRFHWGPTVEDPPAVTDAGALDGSQLDAGDVPQNHRGAPVTCNNVRPSTVPDGGFGLTENGYCKTDAECEAEDAGHDGRCTIVQALGYPICTYDACFVDADCGDAGVCVCRDATNGGANLCVPANCRIDADCGDGSYCSPTVEGCAPYTGVEGYFCHLPTDLCVNDSDCTPPNHCLYDSAIPRWICAPLNCSG